MKPLFTEKSLLEAQKHRYTFRVSLGLTKFQIRQMIEDLFSVKVIGVATMNYKGLTRRTNRGTKVTTSSFKKAIVTLKEGDSIDLFVQEKKAAKAKAKAKK